MFEVLGLGEPAETVYRTLIDVSSADDAELAGMLGMSRGDTAAALAELERLGLAARSGTHPGRFVASPPTIALAALLAQRHDDLKRAEIAMAALAEAYRRAEIDRRTGEVVDVVHGDQAVSQRFLQLQAAARTEVLSLTKSDVLAVPGEENATEAVAAGRGVQYNVVLERASLTRPGVVAGAASALEVGEQVRVVPEVPIRLLVVDREMALVPLIGAPVRSVDALLVHRSGLLDGLIALFDEVWRKATPLVLDSGSSISSQAEGLTELDTRIFALLLAGLTDRAVANQLGTSLRTVQRRVKFLMEAVGAETRLQLGFHAARNGWDAPRPRSRFEAARP